MKISESRIVVKTGLTFVVLLACVLGVVSVQAQDTSTDDTDVNAEMTEAMGPNENANPVATEARGLKDVEAEEGQVRGEAVSAVARELGRSNRPEQAVRPERPERPVKAARPERPQRPGRPAR